ncbi:hypothetical protein STEG23_017386, partial [Scotinomys teguina]
MRRSGGGQSKAAGRGEASSPGRRQDVAVTSYRIIEILIFQKSHGLGYPTICYRKKESIGTNLHRQPNAVVEIDGEKEEGKEKMTRLISPPATN